MLLVIDTNILFAATLRDSTVRKILLSTPIKFVVPKYAFDELLDHVDEICERNGKSIDINLEIMSIIKEHVEESIHSPSMEYIKEAKDVMDPIDPNDAAILAVALSIKCDGIWTDDAHFLKQKHVKVWRTRDLIHFIDGVP